jgi:hypothetical protein
MVVTGWRSAGQLGLGERGPTIKRPTRMTPDPAPVRDEALAVWNDALVRASMPVWRICLRGWRLDLARLIVPGIAALTGSRTRAGGGDNSGAVDSGRW